MAEEGVDYAKLFFNATMFGDDVQGHWMNWSVEHKHRASAHLKD